MRAAKLRGIQLMYKPALQVGGGPQLVQSNIGHSAIVLNPSLLIGLNNVQAGHRIVILGYCDGTAANLSSITDNNGTVYTRHALGAGKLSVWSGVAPVSGNYSITGSCTGNNHRLCMGVIEITASRFDVSLNGPTGANSETQALTPGDIAIVFACGGDANTNTADAYAGVAPLNSLGSTQTGQSFDISFGFAYAANRKGAANYTMTVNNGSFTDYLVCSFIGN